MINRVSSYVASSVVTLTLTLCAACAADNSTTTDNTPLEPSREGRITSIAKTACERYGDARGGCPGYGTAANQKFATEGDCLRDFEQRANSLWPADRCSDGRINSSGYQRCETEVKSYACSGGVGNVLDGIVALDQCNAAKVCTDSPK